MGLKSRTLVTPTQPQPRRENVVLAEQELTNYKRYLTPSKRTD